MENGGLSNIYTILSKEEKFQQNKSLDQIIEFVDNLFYSAIEIHASDIHLQPEENFARIRYRVDGILYDQDSVDLEQLKHIISRIKILAGLDISIHRLPQDGKIKLTLNNLENKKQIIDLRISTFPSTYGEKMVVRILDRSYNLLNLESLGMQKNMLSQIKNLIQKPHGFFLVTGPTGSGKTTTLYAMLSELNKPGKNIVTIEDPVEYAVPGIMQSQVNEKAGFNFQNGLRSLLRQDPDIMMIGEIRDKITAQIAIESALTGHLVFSTLHTNDAAGAITRLIDMGVEPFLINATLTGILAQRLVRKLCNKCKKETPSTLAPEFKNLSATSFKSQGCSECFNLGYKGRTGIFELLVLDDPIRDLVMQKSATNKILNQAKQSGMQTLLNDGIEKVNAGQICIEELLASIPIQ